jgi:hypothetical protein
MSVWHLIVREILYRKLGFALAVLSVTTAVGCLVATVTLLHLFDEGTEQLVARLEAEVAGRGARFEKDTQRRMARLEDDYRKITLGLGFNLLIVPQGQSLAELHAGGPTTNYMPESYATKLAKARVVTVNHLLPILQQRLHWPEQERTVVLVGTRGEVPILGRAQKRPLLERVPPGTVVVGHELHRSLKLKKGDTIHFRGRPLTVRKLYPERGTSDDITLWINLDEAQALLDRPGQISAILALECNCESDRLDRVRAEVASILPDTQVIERASQALARAEARNRARREADDARARAAAEGRAAVEQKRRERSELRRQRGALAAVLLPLVVLGCIVWLGVLTLMNVLERGVEIAILRALGLRSRQVFGLMLARAIAAGLVGTLLGGAAGVAVGNALGELSSESVTLDAGLLVAVLLAAPALCAVVAGLPALLAARRDPAVVLREA